MAEIEISPEHHDFIDEEELNQTSRAVNALAEAKFCGDLAVFRADVLRLLFKHNAMVDGGGWAVFDVDDVSDNEGIVLDSPRKDVLIMAAGGGIKPEGKITPPRIRVFTNEQVLQDSGEAEWITEDFSADPDNDTQYLMSAINLEAKSGLAATSSATFFLIHDNIISMSNYEHFTPFIAINDPDEQYESVVPFGTFNSMPDRIYALSKGVSILASVVDLEPSHKINIP